MAILLDQLLEQCAEAYRKYGNIPVYIETDQAIEGVTGVDVDLFNVRKRNVCIILETTSLSEKTAPLPRVVPTLPQQRTSPPQEPQRKVVPDPKADKGRHRKSQAKNAHQRPATPVSA